jgi:hypothetical protein
MKIAPPPIIYAETASAVMQGLLALIGPNYRIPIASLFKINF